MKTRLLKRLRREVDNLYSIFPTYRIYNNQFKKVWQIKRWVGEEGIVYAESEVELFALELYNKLKRENILYQVKYLRKQTTKKIINYEDIKIRRF